MVGLRLGGGSDLREEGGEVRVRDDARGVEGDRAQERAERLGDIPVPVQRIAEVGVDRRVLRDLLVELDGALEGGMRPPRTALAR